MSLAEKFQITVPYSEKKDAGGQWQDQKSVRVTNGIPDQADGFNNLPKTNITRQDGIVESSQVLNDFRQGFGGNLDQTDGLDNPKVFQDGFTRRNMKATDDQYSGEHVDLFYGEAVDEKGNVGFVERNNYLDRA